MGDFPVTGASEIAGESPFDDDGLLLLSDEEVGFSADSERAKMDPWQIARKYQLELAEKAFQENSVVVLETGCGKTLIAVLLLCKMGPLIKKPQKNICVFLAPTVVLVRQQAGVIQEFTDFRVGINCGDAKHLKSHSDWEKELEQYEVLVMTPQILLGCLLHCFIRMEMISLLIFDECHYAQLDSNHPYAEIMKLFYTAKAARLPRIFGMTASPISGKGASIHSLETLLHAKICLVDNINREELENVIVSPKVKVYHYASSTDISSNSNQIYLEKLVEIKRQCISMLRRTEDNHTSIKNSKRLLHKWHNDLVCCLGSLGLRGALQASRIISNGEHSEQIESAEAKGTSSDDVICPQYLAQAVSALDFDCMKGIMPSEALSY